MIRVTVELVPFGIEDQKITLTQATVWNDLSGTEKSGNYGYQLMTCSRKKDQPRHVYKSGSIEGFPRLQKSVWWLLWYVMKDAFQKK